MVLPVLNVVPNKLICHPSDLFLSQFNVLKSGVYGIWQTVGRICCKQRFPSGLLSKEPLRAPVDVLQTHSISPARPSTLTGIALAASAALADSAPLGLWPASLTVSARPSKSLPFKAAIAFFASSSLGIETKPKPRDRPFSRSVAM